MKWIYNLAILLARVGFSFAGIFTVKATLFTEGRRHIIKSIQESLKRNTSPVVWVHCASLGEFEQGRPVMEKLKSEYSNCKIFLTFFSPSGYEIRKNYDKADYVFYLPWDTKKNAIQVVEAVKPAVAIFIKYEFWYHYSTELKKRNVPILSVSSIFRTNQLFFKSYGGFYRSILFNFSYFFTQNDESVALLKSIGVENCMRAGDTRFDRVYELVKHSEPLPSVEKFKNGEKLMVLGSCWPEDLDVLIPFINEHSRNLKFIIAPHEITESFIQLIEKGVRAEVIRYSKIQHVSPENFQILIIDNIGMLGRLYRYGEFAYVGGAFGKGLHNILEAACYGIPVFFGNKSYQKFQEARDLINYGGAFEVADYQELKVKYEMVNVPQSFLLACEITKQYVLDNLGATEKVMQYCRKHITL